MNDINPNLIKQMEQAHPTHALTVSMGVKAMGTKQAIVTIYDGALFKDDTLKDMAMQAFRVWMDNSDEANNWEPSMIWLDEKDGGAYRATRYVTMRKMK
jgi:hypothetical protein